MTFGVALLLVWAINARMVRALNTTLFGATGDGLKNYYTVLYHVQHDSTLSHFRGMNYPYGEHVVFTDNQPTLSNAIRLIDHVVPIARYTVGIMNGLLLLSIAASAAVLVLIFREFDVPAWYAPPIAIIMAFLAPQVARIGGHYALAYGWVLPAVWWLALRLDRHPSTRGSVYLGILVLLATGLHLYYLALAGGFLVLFWGVRWLQHPSRAALRRTAEYLAVQVLLPFAVYRTWLAATDPVRDRPATLGLLFGYWEGVFLPIRLPLGGWIDSIVKIRTIDWEAIAYVGLPATAFSIGILLRGLQRLLRGPWRDSFRLADDARLRAAAWGGVILLLVAFGVPLRWTPTSVLRLLGPVTQLRAIARLAWVFFYVINVAAFVQLFRWGTTQESRRIRWAVWWLPVVLLAIEAWQYQVTTPLYSPTPVAASLARPPADGRPAVDPARYQAIIPLPYFHVGSELVNRLPSAIFSSVLRASLETGLPMTAVYLSRTSRSQTEANLELVTQHDHVPFLLEAVDQTKPFLIWRDRSAPLTPEEAWLVRAAAPVFQDADIQLLELTADRWRRRIVEAPSEQVAEPPDPVP